jgi:hypothetical protein
MLSKIAHLHSVEKYFKLRKPYIRRIELETYIILEMRGKTLHWERIFKS